MNKFSARLDGYFEISKRKSKISLEIIGGVTTFLAMAYILAVNPGIIAGWGGPRFNAVFMATAIGAMVGTLIMGLLAKLPFAQAPGMGLNGMVAGLAATTIGGVTYGFDGAMAAVFISGILFLLLSIFGMREKVFNGVPAGIRAAIPVGIGLFIAFIGLQNAGSGVIVSDVVNMVGLVNFSAIWKGGLGSIAINAVIIMFGLVLIAVLTKFKVKGAVIIAIAACTIIGIPLGVTPIENIKTGWNIVDNFKNYFSFGEKGAFGMFVFGFETIFQPKLILNTIVVILSFCMIDMFDTMGTLFGCAVKCDLLDEKGQVVNFKKAMFADSIATVAGAALGTSTVTTFVESGAGVAAGARTGLSSVVTAALFLLAIFVSPVFAVIPGAATAPALIYVGVLMMTSITKINFKDVRIAVPAFLTIAFMPLSHSITNGIGVGLVSYVFINIFCFIVDSIRFAVQKGRAPADAAVVTEPLYQTSDEETAAENQLKAEVYVQADGQSADSDAATDAAPAPKADSQKQKTLVRPKWNVPVVTLIIAALFLIMFFVPTAG